MTTSSLNRRSFAAASLASIAACGMSSRPMGISGLAYAVTPQVPLSYQDLDSERWLGKPELLVAVDGSGAVTEGPAVDERGQVFFSDMPASKIRVWSPDTRQLTTFREQSNRANGLCFLPDGDLLCCETAARRVTRTNMKTGEISVLADRYEGRPLAQPNDICFDQDRRIYFTSRTSPIDPTDEALKAVYRIDPDGSLHRLLVWPEVHMPNGLAFSPDYQRLYLVEAHPDAELHREIRVYDVRDGQLSNGRTIVQFYPGRSGDGMAIDTEENLYVAAGLHQTRETSETLDTQPGIHVFTSAGKLLAFRQTPVDLLTNCTFGGPDLRSLYITCGPQLLHLRTSVAGKSDYAL